MKHWQDGVNAVVGVWLMISPWILGFTDDGQVLAVVIVLGAALLAGAIGALVLPRAWEAWSEGVVALATIASPWAIGAQSRVAFRDSAVASGLVVLAMVVWILLVDRRLRPGGPRNIPVR